MVDIYAASAFWSTVSVASARVRWSSTMCVGPPSSSRVSARSMWDPADRSTSQSRCMTTCRYGAFDSLLRGRLCAYAVSA